MADLRKIVIDGKEIEVDPALTLIQACEQAGIEVPRFCYHERLSIAGNCRMCLVEVAKAPKPVASCAMPLMPGMAISTDTPVVKKAREGVMEFLLINHPLDCPVCDQGGECDLQDLAMNFGSDRGRFTDSKRSVEDKNLGPLVKTVMTRCIHCTRCVRFAEEIAGIQDMGVTGRGNASEIGTYVEKLLASELSGNLIDICPVGALTAKPQAFTARSWELRGTESVDVSDALGSNIRVDSRGSEIMRVVPRLNEAVNEEWISDRARFQFDGLRRQRLTAPLLKDSEGRLKPVPWAEALGAATRALSGAQNAMGVAGRLACAESMTALKDLLNGLGHENLRLEGSLLGADVRSGYVLNAGIASVDQCDALLLVGCDPRKEATVLNARIRKATLNGLQRVGAVGAVEDLTYDVEDLGEGAGALKGLLGGKGKKASAGGDFMQALKAAERPLLLVGSQALQRPDVLELAHAVAKQCGAVTADWNGFGVLHHAASAVGALDLGLVPSGLAAPGQPADVVYLLGSDDYDEADVPEGAFVIYQGTHGDRGANRADLVLPGCAYTEKAGTYVNTEGRVQRTKKAVPAAGQAREDWAILRALAEASGLGLGYPATADGVRARMAEIAPGLANVDTREAGLWLNGEYVAAALAGRDASPQPGALESPIESYWMTDAVSRASLTMAKCIEARSRMVYGEGEFVGGAK